MANFLKITDRSDIEVIINVDKIEMLIRRATYNTIYLNGGEIQINDETYEKIKERILHPYGKTRKT